MKVIKIRRVMILIALFIFPLFFGALASGSAQPITFSVKDASVKEVFSEIRKQAGYHFLYNENLVNKVPSITLTVKNEGVENVLTKVLSGNELTYTMRGKNITISKSMAKQKQAQLLTVQQDSLVTGTVYNGEDGTTLGGVNVNVKGTRNRVATNGNGQFSIRVPANNPVLVFSYIGFSSSEVNSKTQSAATINLMPDAGSLSDVVVIGYGKQQRTEVTGAISSISAAQLKEIPATSFENAIQGKVSGVDISIPSGEPGASPQIRIRGTGSISAGNDPLYVIDGLPISRNTNLQPNNGQRTVAFAIPKVNPLASINPNDIQSIEILKDAASAGIYGSRGSNGVVMITTKKGLREQTQVNFNAYSGIQNATNLPRLMNSAELIQYAKDSRNANYLQTNDPTNPLSKDYNPLYNPNTNAGRPNVDFILIPETYVNWDGTDTDWLGLTFSPGTINNYNVSIGGGKDNFNYYTSAGFYDEKGIIEGSSLKRYTIKSSVVNDITDKIQVGANINLAYTNNHRVPANAPYFANPPGIVYSALVHSPVVHPYNADGTINQKVTQNQLGGGTTTADNPLAIMQAVKENLQNFRSFGNIYAQYNFLEDFTFKTYLGADIDNIQQSSYKGNSLLYRGALKGDPYAQASAGLGVNWLWENTLNYNKKFNEHSVDAVAGYTAQHQTQELKVVIAQNFPDDQVQTISGGIVTGGNGIKEEWSLVSALARVNYAYKERYLASGTIRSDRSSRFGFGNQTGVFPSGSIGWRISSEPFFESIKAISDLKVRASYGLTGNFEIPNYGSIGLLSASNYVFNNNIVNGIGPSTLSNTNLSWETKKSLDIGLDFGILSDRIYGAFDYYRSVTSDLLLMVTVPSSSGFTTALTNIGSVENKGFEFSLSSRNLVGEFKWGTDLNFSTNKNKVLKLGPDNAPILSVGAAGLRHITKVGSSVGSYYGYQVEGIYQTQQEIANAPKDQLAPAARPGDLRFKDVNGDGKITPADRTITGDYFPDFTYGMTNKFKFKSVDLSVFVQGVLGRDILNLTQRHLLNGEANFNSYSDYNFRWKSEAEPGNGVIPRADRNSGVHGNNFRESSFQVEDGSYLRLRNITLGYEFNIPKIKDKVRVYVSGTNLAIWTKYRGLNPEVNLQPDNSLTPGEDYGAYPLSRTFMMGVNVNF